MPNQFMAEIVVIGAGGMVGSRVVELSKFRDFMVTPDSKRLDITQKDLDLSGADVVVNFAAYTDVSNGEKQRGDKNGSCWKTNVDGVQNVLDALHPDAYFIQIGSDMCHSGSSENPGPYNEDDQPETNPDKVTWYGFSKGEARRRIVERRNTAEVDIIYPVVARSSRKQDFLRRSLELHKKGQLYPLFEKQKISVVLADDVAEVVDKLIEERPEGVFHATSSDLTSPLEITRYLIVKTGGNDDLVAGQLPENSVRYPRFGGLTENKLGIRFGTWREIVDRLVDQGINEA